MSDFSYDYSHRGFESTGGESDSLDEADTFSQRQRRRGTQGKTSTSSSGAAAHSPLVMIAINLFFGCVLSYSAGRTPGSSPVITEMALPAIATGLFILMWASFDTLSVGASKLSTTKGSEDDYIRADRAHRNQVDQMPSFFACLWTFSVIVNGRVGGMLGLIWTMLRMSYSASFRSAHPSSEAGLVKYTVPAYMVVNTMASASLIHGMRMLVSS